MLKRVASHFDFVRLPILSGHLKGMWWSPFGRGKILRHLSGTYEPRQSDYFAKRIGSGATVLDVGANLGHYSLLFSKLVGSTGRVVAFEPSPVIGSFLESHVAANRCDNVVTIMAAAGAKAGRLYFDAGRGSGTGAISDSGTLTVDIVTLDEVSRLLDVSPDYIKIDVEGFGHTVLQGAQEILAESLPTIYLSLHNQIEYSGSAKVLKRLGYSLETDDEGQLICQGPSSSATRKVAA